MKPLAYSLVVVGRPDSGQCHTRALGFASALSAAGHRLRRVFFYSSGVQVALNWEDSPKDSWLEIAREHEAELCLCSASAERYGVTTPPEGYTIVGLGTLMEAGIDSDRVLTFD